MITLKKHQRKVDSLEDSKLSWRAKGLHCYLLKKFNENKEFYKKDIYEASSESSSTVRKAIDELKETGYLRENEDKEWHIYDVSYKEREEYQKQIKQEKKEKAAENIEKKIKIKRKSKREEPEKIFESKFKEKRKELMDFIHDNINENLPYHHKAQREAAGDMIKNYGLEESIRFAKAALKANDEEYAPVITTPYDLKTKLSQLAAYYRRKKNNEKTKI